jgi:hypothetical protein
LNISFPSEKEIEHLRHTQRRKPTARNLLGVINRDEWIFSLNIGNVMHLNPLQTEELNAEIEPSHEFTA